jgi:hypothetical protein
VQVTELNADHPQNAYKTHVLSSADGVCAPAPPPWCVSSSRVLYCGCTVLPAAYDKDGQQYSLLEYILRETEQLHGKVRRYTSPDEHAFYPGQCCVVSYFVCACPQQLLLLTDRTRPVNGAAKIMPGVAAFVVASVCVRQSC